MIVKHKSLYIPYLLQYVFQHRHYSIVTPIEPGNFLIVYTIHVIILIILLKEFRKYKSINVNFIKGASLVLAVIYLSAFIYVHYEHEKRVQLLKQQIKDHPRQEVYTVESLPFEHYMHHPVTNQ